MRPPQRKNERNWHYMKERVWPPSGNNMFYCYTIGPPGNNANTTDGTAYERARATPRKNACDRHRQGRTDISWTMDELVAVWPRPAMWKTWTMQSNNMYTHCFSYVALCIVSLSYDHCKLYLCWLGRGFNTHYLIVFVVSLGTGDVNMKCNLAETKQRQFQLGPATSRRLIENPCRFMTSPVVGG